MTENPAPRRSTLVVGVLKTRGTQLDALVRNAVVFAEQFDAELAIATVDPTRYEVRKNPDGTVVAWDIDPDLADEEVTERFDTDLAAHLEELLDPSEIDYSLHALAGEPAHELARLAHRLGADAIIIGTRKPGLSTSAHEFFSGSVAVHLAHRQHRPVIVIPLSPIAYGEKLPWERR